LVSIPCARDVCLDTFSLFVFLCLLCFNPLRKGCLFRHWEKVGRISFVSIPCARDVCLDKNRRDEDAGNCAVSIPCARDVCLDSLRNFAKRFSARFQSPAQGMSV